VCADDRNVIHAGLLRPDLFGNMTRVFATDSNTVEGVNRLSQSPHPKPAHVAMLERYRYGEGKVKNRGNLLTEAHF